MLKKLNSNNIDNIAGGDINFREADIMDLYDILSPVIGDSKQAMADAAELTSNENYTALSATSSNSLNNLTNFCKNNNIALYRTSSAANDAQFVMNQNDFNRFLKENSKSETIRKTMFL